MDRVIGFLHRKAVGLDHDEHDIDDDRDGEGNPVEDGGD